MTRPISRLAAVLLGIVLLPAAVPAQSRVSGIVEDPTGAPISGARISGSDPSSRATAGPDGLFELDAPSGRITVVVSARGFADETVVLSTAARLPQRIVLEPSGVVETLTVAAAAGLRLTAPASVTVVDRQSLAAAPALALDDQLRSVPGFSLFRRSSSRVANPTTQGVTLRGLASSGASRTLVLADGVPLNDPFGGWVHWSRIPAAALDRVAVARGGASDLFGADAIGGVIEMDTARRGARVYLDAGERGTARASVFAGGTAGKVALRGGAERFTTDGFVIVAPESRGSIDIAASSRHTALYGGAMLPAQGRARVDLRGGYATERRGNGTPFQANATTVRHGSAVFGGEFGSGFVSARVNGLSEDYDQTFSAVAPGRASERPTSAQRVSASSAGLALEWLQPWRSAVGTAALSFREIRADLSDQSLSVPGAPPVLTDATQRMAAMTGQVTSALSPRVTLSAGLRGEVWSTRRIGEASGSAFNLGPRASVAFQVDPRVALRASVHSGYRVPSVNELYRDFRVGGALTRANADLRPERSAGAEGSAWFRRGPLTLRAAGFWTRLDRAIVNVTLEADDDSILRRRQNAGRIRARGLEVETDLRAGRILTFTGSVAFTDSTFVRGAELEGLRVPQVPRVQAAAGLRAAWRRASAAVEWRFSGRQFDDDRNELALERASMVDARAGWRILRGVEAFAAIENLFDEEQDVGRTPLRTIGMPRGARVGLRLLR